MPSLLASHPICDNTPGRLATGRPSVFWTRCKASGSPKTQFPMRLHTKAGLRARPLIFQLNHIPQIPDPIVKLALSAAYNLPSRPPKCFSARAFSQVPP